MVEIKTEKAIIRIHAGKKSSEEIIDAIKNACECCRRGAKDAVYI